MSVKVYDSRQTAMMRMLRTYGWTYKRIAAKMHCSIPTVKRYCVDYKEVRTQHEPQNIR